MSRSWMPRGRVRPVSSRVARLPWRAARMPRRLGAAAVVVVVGLGAVAWGGAQPAAAATSLYPCAGYSGLQTTNPTSAVLQDKFTWDGYRAVKVGDGHGNINWKLNPYRNASWYMWFHSLRWLGAPIEDGRRGNATALAHATAIAYDWVRDNPYSWHGNVGAWESTMHRTNVLICLREVLIQTHGGTLPRADSWLTTALLNHARFLQVYFSGWNNHGTDESIAMLGVGCLLGRKDYRDLAASRLAQGVTRVLDSQGANNEQSTGYALFNYSLWGRAHDALVTCRMKTTAISTITARRLLLATFLAHATTPLRTLVQIGATGRIPPTPLPGTAQEWIASGGAKGTPPKGRVAVYRAGYVFGRSGWGNGSRPFAQESAYSLRFGPARTLHGHDDHTAITWTDRGRDILIDAGQAAYNLDAWQRYSEGPYAHNELVVPGMGRSPATTLRTAKVNANKSELFMMTDSPKAGVQRSRIVLVLYDPDMVIVFDRASSTARTSFQELWHLAPGQGVVAGRSSVIAQQRGDTTKTALVQLSFRGQAIPRGTVGVAQGRTNPIQGWYWSSLTSRQAAPVITFARTGRSATMVTLITAAAASSRIAITQRMSGSTYVYTIGVGSLVARVGLTAGGTLYRIS